MPRKLKIAPGGVAAELDNPKSSGTLEQFRVSLAQGIQRPGSDGSPLEENPTVATKHVAKPQTPWQPPIDDEDDDRTEHYLRHLLEPRQLPGKKARGTRIRWYHRTTNGRECWAFTTTRKAFEDWKNGGSLSSKGARYPDGTPVTNPEDPPLTRHLRCGTCGTSNVQSLQQVFYLDG